MPGLRAGAARGCITPRLGASIGAGLDERRATDILDNLNAKALVLENDRTSIAIVVCDLIGLPEADIALAKQEASRLTGIPEDHISISCTHTHYGPNAANAMDSPRDEEFMATAPGRIADAVKLAQNRLTEAEVGIAAGTAPGETFNRRWHMRDGSVRMNPGHQHPDLVRPAGPKDPEVLVLAIRDREGRPLALLANYALHYVGGPYANSISADYFGHFDRALQRLAGAQFVGIMANGCCGDLNNLDFTRPRPEMPHPTFQAERVANVVAAAAYGAWQGLRGYQYDSDPVLAAAAEVMTFRRRQATEEQLQRARAIVEGREPAEAGPPFAPPEFARFEKAYAREALCVSEEPLERPVSILALRVGDLGMVGLPGEIFVEYGLQIKERSPFAHTMCIELANGDFGYCPTDKALTEGSYETTLARSAKAAPGTEGAMVAAALGALNRVRGQG